MLRGKFCLGDRNAAIFWGASRRFSGELVFFVFVFAALVGSHFFRIFFALFFAFFCVFFARFFLHFLHFFGSSKYCHGVTPLR